MKEVEFKYAGIKFLVKLDVTMEDTLKDSVIESVQGVFFWDEKDRQYKTIACNTEEFEKEMADVIQEAFEEMYNDEKAAIEDMEYEYRREHEVWPDN